MLETHIMMSFLICRLVLILVFHLALTLVLRLALFHVLCLSSLMDRTIAHMVLVHERTALSLDALVTAHVLIVVIVSRVGLIFLLEGPSPTLSRDTWTVHAFPDVVHVPLDQVVRCKGMCKLPLVAWLSAGFLRFISLTPALSHRPLLGGLENTWLMDSGCSHLMTGVTICLTCVGGHSFSHSMNTHEPFLRLDGLLVSFSCELG
jgi:hypothetical protein